jgi:hypothetical protein
MEDNNLDLTIGKGRSLDEWVEAVEFELYSIVYEIIVQLADSL